MYLAQWTFRFAMLFVIPDAEKVVMDSDVFYQYHSAVSMRAMSIYGERCVALVRGRHLDGPLTDALRMCHHSQLVQRLSVLVQVC